MPETDCCPVMSFCWVPRTYRPMINEPAHAHVHLSSRGYFYVSASRLTWLLIGQTDGNLTNIRDVQKYQQFFGLTYSCDINFADRS